VLGGGSAEAGRSGRPARASAAAIALAEARSVAWTARPGARRRLSVCQAAKERGGAGAESPTTTPAFSSSLTAKITSAGAIAGAASRIRSSRLRRPSTRGQSASMIREVDSHCRRSLMKNTPRPSTGRTV
jgi:hypothetical protein